MSRIVEFNFVTDEFACFSLHSHPQGRFFRWRTADADNPTDFSIVLAYIVSANSQEWR